jgi:membrane protein implicated in regulation of membrane protease activity
MLPLVDQLYYVTAAVGFIFVVGSFLLGQIGDNSTNTGDGGDSGDFGNVDSSGGDGGDFGNVDSGGDGGDFGNVDSNFANKAVTGIRDQAKGQRIGPVLFILKILSPSTIASFLFCFGMFGIIVSRSLPFLGALSLIPALLLGFIGYKAMSAFLSGIISRMQSSKNFTDEQVIGKMAEVTVPLSKGKTGEITFVAGSSRQTSSARSLKSDQSFKAGSRVIISDVKDGIFLVEPWTYDLEAGETLDSGQTIKTEKNKDSMPHS